MSRQYKNGKCSCWEKVDKELGDDAELDLSMTFSGGYYICVAVHDKRQRKRGGVPRVFASHCPFCGAKLKETK